MNESVVEEAALDWLQSLGWTGGPAEQLGLLPQAQEHILAQQDGKDRLLDAVRDLSKAFALATPSEEALLIRDDVAFFQAVRAVLAKRLLSSSECPLTETDRGVT